MFRVSVPAPPSIESKVVNVDASAPSALMLKAVKVSLPAVPSKLFAPVVSVKYCII